MHTSVYKYFIILVIVFCGVINADGQSIASSKDTVSTEEILVTANKIKMSSMLSPNKVQVLDDKIISNLNENKLADILSYGDGIFIKDYGFNSGLKTISINSTQSEHALVLLNGIELNSPQNAQFDSDLLLLNDINRIEISNGGASSLYGSEAIGGVVNIITNEPSFNKLFNLDISNTTGSYGFNNLFISSGSKVNISHTGFLNFHLSYSNEQARNDYSYDFFNGFNEVLQNRINNDYHSNTINFISNYSINKTTSLDLFTLYSNWNRGVPGPDFGYSVSESRKIDENLISRLGFNKDFGKNISFKTSFTFKNSLEKYFDPLTYNTIIPINDYYKIYSFVNSSEINFLDKSKNEITTGYDLNYNTISSDEINKSNRTQIGVYAAGKFEINKIADKISIYPSLRYDRYSDINKNIFTGKIGINIKPLKSSNFSIKGSFSNNFRAPTFNELYWKGLGNEYLQPEKSVCFDGGFYYNFNLLANNTLEASYFNINTVNRIIWTPVNSGIWRPINIGRAKSEGIDITYKNKFDIIRTLSIGFSVNYNYSNAIKESADYPGDPTFKKQLIDIPQEYTKSSIFLDYAPKMAFLKLISLNIFYTFIGNRFSDLENTMFVPYYDLLDANINLEVNLFKTLTSLKFSVNNITNKNYEVISGYPMPLRNFKLQIGIKY